MDVKEQLKEFFKNNFMVEIDGDFDDNESFLENGIIDSTGVLELVMFLEENYNIKVADEELLPENLDSFNNIEKYLKSKTG
jgi:acyl carrier protein